MQESPIFDGLCTEFGALPKHGVPGLRAVIEGRCQPGADVPPMALSAPPKASVQLPVGELSPVAKIVSEQGARVLDGEAQVRATRKTPARRR